MARVTIQILSVFLIISMLNCTILSVFIKGMYDTEPSTCEFNEDCPDDQKCSNNSCVDACEKVRCGLNQKCVADLTHKGICECLPGYKSYSHNFNICYPSCSNDSDCSTQEKCLPDVDGFPRCVCRSGYAPDPIYPEYTCRYNCQNNANCNEISATAVCKKGLCIEFCSSTICPASHRQCIVLGTASLCVTNDTVSKMYGE